MSTDSTDRTVHAGLPGGVAVVRYDKAGAWYLEWPPAAEKKRKRISVQQAALLAERWEQEDGCYIAFGRPGGGRFDSTVRSVRSAILMFDKAEQNQARADLFGHIISRLLD